MVDINNILQWKQEYGDIFQLQIQEQHFIFCPIGREEYKQIVIMDLDIGEFQEVLCFQSVVYPQDYDYSNGIAGIAEVLSDAILDASGLHMGQAGDLLAQFREEMLNYDYQVDCMIHEAFPEYTLEEISTWPVRKTMFYLSRAEWVLRTLKGVPIEYIDNTIKQDFEQQQEIEQQKLKQQEAEQQKKQPQRKIRKELVEGPEEKPRPVPNPKVPEGGIQSEEELLSMLAGTGKKVSKPITSLDDEPKPELNWFGYMDELKGEFD